LKEANIITRRDSFVNSVNERGKKMCEYCLEFIISGKRKTSICMDCIVQSLKIQKVLKTDVHKRLIVKKVHPAEYDNGIFFDKSNINSNSKKKCDICLEHIIHSKRGSCVCIDCMVDALINKGIVRIEQREIVDFDD
jgi:hypothetical protein